MKRHFHFLKNYLDIERIKNGIKGPIEINEAEDFSAIYFFISRNNRFILPWGNSPIIYIGKADKLRTRLMQHNNNYKYADPKTKFEYSRYNYMNMEGGFEIYYLRTKGRESAKCLESKVLENFYDKYGALPVGNGAFSYR